MIQLSDHFGYKRLLQFTFPSIIMLIFTSIYGVVDGFFVSNFAGKTPFAAVNFIMPVLLILGCVGFMFGTGGSALIAKTMGEGDRKRANEIFSMVVYAAAICGIVLAVCGEIFLRPIAASLGAEGQLLEDCVLYGRISLLSLPAYVLQYEFQCLFATAGKTKLGLYVTIASGLTNIVMDALFVGCFRWGVAGAAAATALSEYVGGILPILYFARKNSSMLQLVRTRFHKNVLIKACTNGSSELMTSISTSVVGMLYNAQLLKFAGENGVAAYGVLMYVNLIFQSAFIGYSVGGAPVISYHFGAANHGELKNLLKRSEVLIAIFAGVMFLAALLLARPLATLFVGYDAALYQMTVHAFSIFRFAFLFSGFVIFASAFFTALNDGLTSALISFLRTLVFQVAAVLLLPQIWQLDGIWASTVTAEVMALVVSTLFLFGKRKKYHYG